MRVNNGRDQDRLHGLLTLGYAMVCKCVQAYAMVSKCMQWCARYAMVCKCMQWCAIVCSNLAATLRSEMQMSLFWTC